MRKLDKKNKSFILALSAIALIAFAIIITFIIMTISKTTIKYDVLEDSYVYNEEGELIHITEDTYAKKNVFDKYYVLVNNKKEDIGAKPVIYNAKTRELKLLGSFYEVSQNGDVKKYKGETIIDKSSKSRLFKIADRKYLVVSSVIRSEDNSLHTNDYLLVDIDKAGNAYLYNNNVNIKTFNDLELITEDFHFDVSREYLIINNERVDLAKVNGSTNEHDRTIEEEKPDEGGEGGNTTEVEAPKPPVNTIIQQEIVEQYVSRKTTITGIETTESEMTINYVVYDPFFEYEEVYVNVYQNGSLIGKYSLGTSLTSHKITNLKAHTNYNLEFFYSYKKDNGELETVKFDTSSAMTKNIKASIRLEKVSSSVVRYILIVEGGYRLDSATVEMYIDDQKVASDTVNTVQAASTNGYKGSLSYTGTGEFVTLKLTNCIYNGESISIDASYKYKY